MLHHQIEKRSGAPAAAFGGMVTFEKLIGRQPMPDR